MFKIFSSKSRKNPYGWFGNYSSWEEVMSAADGYDSAGILNKTRDSLLRVKNGKAVYERDSVLFDKIEYPFPLLTCLLRSASLLQRPIHVLDFGGSLGSTYYQARNLTGPEICSSWNIVEQEHYVTTGKKHFEDDYLKFYNSIDDCLQDKKIDLVLLSSSVQYLEAPHAFLEKLAAYNFDFIVFDRTAFHHGKQDRLTLQIVPPEIYKASYPAWFFQEEAFLKHYHQTYRTICEFPSYVEGEAVLSVDHQPIGFNKGFYLVNTSLYA
ncbi:methyltransferase, TIGR04325 family [Pedobacter cryoconitis]|uniref:Putative methyltransferase (TIGR04325 family) n=1 Tax=Pedobacter cryoconitis TaxID=188932 RepID=A0A7X0MI68_9SPHI|nr:methyltransferase, TIGR04325 family [Pedobacter cryoconitis]MBB6500057.1 putative methyltransferase (TIGR04325 family) [Pedobacter cryoconitis]